METHRPFCDRCSYEGPWMSENAARRAIERHSLTKRHLENGGKSISGSKAKEVKGAGFLASFRVLG